MLTVSLNQKYNGKYCHFLLAKGFYFKYQSFTIGYQSQEPKRMHKSLTATKYLLTFAMSANTTKGFYVLQLYAISNCLYDLI